MILIVHPADRSGRHGDVGKAGQFEIIHRVQQQPRRNPVDPLRFQERARDIGRIARLDGVEFVDHALEMGSAAFPFGQDRVAKLARSLLFALVRIFEEAKAIEPLPL